MVVALLRDTAIAAASLLLLWVAATGLLRIPGLRITGLLPVAAHRHPTPALLWRGAGSERCCRRAQKPRSVHTVALTFGSEG